jgi:ligand-binding sensor domain-containing protein
MRTLKSLILLSVIFTLIVSCKKPNDDHPEINTNFSTKILSGYFVTSIAFDKKGNAWIGTYSQGLIKYNDGNFVVYNSSNSLISDQVIWDIAVDGKDNIWIGSDQLVKYDGANFTSFSSKNSPIPEDFIYSIAVDSKDNIWFTACRYKLGGLVKYDGTNWTIFTPGNSNLPINYVKSIAVDKDDNIWLALQEKVNQTYLAKISGSDWTFYSSNDLGLTPYWYGNIQINSKNQLCCSNDFELSSASENPGAQVFKFNGDSSEQLEFDRTTVVYRITVDNKDNIWCYGKYGLEGYSLYAVYNGNDWIIDYLTFKNAGLLTIEQAIDNKIWVGTYDGIYINN